MTATLTQVVKQFQQDWTGQLELDAILTAAMASPIGGGSGRLIP